ADVDIPKNLDVVADEADVMDDDIADACRRVAVEDRLDGRSEPLVAGHALALEGEVVGGKADGLRDQLRGRAAFALVRVAVGGRDVLDERRPVAHREVDRDTEAFFEQLRLFGGPAEQGGGAADIAVAVRHLVDYSLVARTSAAHVIEIGIDVFDAGRGAVSE